MKATFDNIYRESFLFTYFMMDSYIEFVFLAHIYTNYEKNYIFVYMLPNDNE